MQPTKKVVASLSLAIASVIGIGVAFAASPWSATQTGTGAGKAQARTLTFAVSAGSPTAQLYPGGSGDVTFSVTNPNPFAITIDTVALNGTSKFLSGDSTCDASNSGTPVTFSASLTSATGLTVNATTLTPQLVTLPANVTMVAAADNACQGKTFTANLDVTAHQGSS